MSEDDNDLENVDDEDLQQVRSAVRVVPQVEKRKKEKKSKKKKKEKKAKRSKSPSEEAEDTKPKRKVLAKSRKYHEEVCVVIAHVNCLSLSKLLKNLQLVRVMHTILSNAA